jgi:hypothetical protein
METFYVFILFLSVSSKRHYGYYSNKSRGLREKAGTDDDVPTIVKNEMPAKVWQQNWARLIQKIYEVDPLIWLDVLFFTGAATAWSPEAVAM